MEKRILKKIFPILLTLLLMTLLSTVAASATEVGESCTHPSPDATGICADCQTQLVAKVTIGDATTYYADLVDAVAAANGQTATVDMLADYALPAATASGAPAPLAITGGTITFRTNGHMVKIVREAGQSEFTYRTPFEIKNATFHMNAEGTNWKIETNRSFTYLISCNEAEFTLTGGHFENAAEGSPSFLELHKTNAQVSDVSVSGNFYYAVTTYNANVQLRNLTIDQTYDNTVSSYAETKMEIISGTYAKVQYNSPTTSSPASDLFKVFSKGSTILMQDGTPAEESDVTPQKNDETNRDFSIRNITVTPCTHTGETSAQNIQAGTHRVVCANCDHELRDEACAGGTATCTSTAVCTACSTAYGEMDAANHASEAYNAYTNGNGTHDLYHSCCNAPGDTDVSCTYAEDSLICTLCGGADLGEHLTNAAAEFTAAVNAKIATLEAREDLDDTAKAEITQRYQSILDSRIDIFSSAPTPDALEFAKNQEIILLDIWEGLFNYEAAIMLNTANLTQADLMYLKIVSSSIIQRVGPLSNTGDLNLLRSAVDTLNAALDYSVDCMELFMHINSRPNFEVVFGESIDELKEMLFGSRYIEPTAPYSGMMSNVSGIIYFGEQMNALEVGKAMAYAFNEVWKIAVQHLENVILEDEAAFMQVIEGCAMILEGMGSSLMNSPEEPTLARATKLAEEAKVQMTYVFYMIQDVNISLGESIKINYYISKPEGDSQQHTAQITFSINGYTQTVNGVTEGDRVKFVFDGIAPQWMGDTITAVLSINGTVIQTADYSVIRYLEKLMGTPATELGMSEEQYDAMYALVGDLVVYGGAAQVFTGHNTDALVSEGMTGTEFQTIQSTDAQKTDEGGEGGITFTAATVFFDSVNALMFKFTAADLSDVTFTVKVNDGTESEISYVDNGDGTYTIATDGILAQQFDDIYTVTAYRNGEKAATLTYSVKSYVYAKQTDDGHMAALAKALYNYGIAAKAYQAITQ